jgi:1-deoxy-D-xylulose-5-phosphate synthase
LGIPDIVVEHGEQSELYKECNYDAPAIEKAVLALLDSVPKTV